MALLYFEGFDHISSADPSADLVMKGWLWPSAGNATKIAGQLGGSQLRFGQLQTTTLEYVLPSTYSTLIVGFRLFWETNKTSGTSDIFYFKDGSTIQCGLSVIAPNKITFWRGTNANVLATTTTTFVAGSYYFIELKVKFDNTTGTYELKVGGATDFSATSQDTQNSANAQATTVALNGPGTNPIVGFDDLYVCDVSGGAPANNFLGIIRVETAYPTSADATTWTPNASTNVSRVQETAADNDTTYNSTSTTTNVDTFNHGALSSTPVTIFGVAVTAKMRKDDVSLRTARTKLKSGTTTSDGASGNIETSYKFLRDQYNVDPNTAAAWTTSNVNATKIGYELVS